MPRPFDCQDFVPPTDSAARITLAFSRADGIVAVASGEQYAWARTALEASGFQRRDDGTYALPLAGPDAARATVTGLVRAAHRHQTAVTTSSRRCLGDVADDISMQLPGTWSAEVEVYGQPAWQEDLVPWLWDAGELSHLIQSERILQAAVLSNGAGIDLLLSQRPGHHHAYVVGAFAPDGFDDNYEEPHAPSSLVIPAAPGLVARAIADRFLPAYQQALRRLKWSASVAVRGANTVLARPVTRVTIVRARTRSGPHQRVRAANAGW